MNNKPEQYLQELYAADRTAWLSLLNSLVWHKLISRGTSISLTLTRSLIQRITTTRNNKWRRKYILQLVNVLTTADSYKVPPVGHHRYKDSTNPAILNWLLVLLNVHGTSIKVPSVEVRLLDRNNSPIHTPILIGDSIHYESCLRTGVVRRYRATNLRPPNAMTLTEVKQLLTVDDTSHRGCNVDHIDDECTAFTNMSLMYLVVGDCCSINNTGYLCRARVHCLKLVGSEELVYVINRVYGDVRYTQQLYEHLLKLYPGKVYTTREDAMCYTVDSTSTCVSSTNVYPDDLETSEVYQVLHTNDAVNSVQLGRISRDTVHIILQLDNEVLNYYLHHDRPNDRNVTYTVTKSTRRSIGCPDYHTLNDGMAPVVTYLCNKYNLPYTIQREHKYYFCINTSLPIGLFGKVSWKFKGIQYSIQRVHEFIVLRKGYQNYDFVSKSWVSVYTTCGSRNAITRHTVKYLDQFLPKRIDAAFLRNMSRL